MNELIKKVKSEFSRKFSGKPTMVCSPGRVNLIGEHTDYNMGFVLPAAIDKAIIFMINQNDVNKIRLSSVDMQPSYYETEVKKNYSKTGVEWADYMIGVVQQLQQAGHDIGGFDCAFGGNIPIGAGLSSSAALEGGVAYGLSEIFDLNLSLLDMTSFAMKAENEFVGVQCGIMDQFASLHGKEGSVLKLDCRSLDFEYYPFEWDNIRILLCDTKVRRTLAGSEYNIRRVQCEEGVKLIQKSNPDVVSLRDVTFEELEAHKNNMDEVVYRRCLYVLKENYRVNQACNDLLKNNLSGFGSKMYQSHYGLRDNYEVSCEELDILVEATESLEGILGARMMGGGFGGCTINLVALESLDESIEFIRNYYSQKTNKDPDFHVVKIGKGTHEIINGS